MSSKVKLIRVLLPTTLLACALMPCVALAWGGRGHAMIDRAAVQSLPDDGPVFLKKYQDFIADSASLPDAWRQDAAPFSRLEEDPNHGWFQEQFKFMHPIPRSRFEFMLALYKEQQRLKNSNPAAAKLTNVRWTGTLPYAAMEVYGHLVTGFRSYRSIEAKHKSTKSIEADCAFYVAWLGHYVGDGAQPLHVTIQHDGWQGPNPKGYTTDHTIHSRMESKFVDAMKLTDQDIVPQMQPLDPMTNSDVFESLLAYLDQSHTYVEQVYQIDKRGGFADPNDAQARHLIVERTAAGASMLRNLVERAWRESALPATQLDPAPVDPSNPAYNPETGSAPAARSPELSR